MNDMQTQEFEIRLVEDLTFNEIVRAIDNDERWRIITKERGGMPITLGTNHKDIISYASIDPKFCIGKMKDIKMKNDKGIIEVELIESRINDIFKNKEDINNFCAVPRVMRHNTPDLSSSEFRLITFDIVRVREHCCPLYEQYKTNNSDTVTVSKNNTQKIYKIIVDFHRTYTFVTDIVLVLASDEEDAVKKFQANVVNDPKLKDYITRLDFEPDPANNRRKKYNTNDKRKKYTSTEATLIVEQLELDDNHPYVHLSDCID